MTFAACSHKPHGLTLAMAGAEQRLQFVLGEPTADGWVLLASREWTVPGQSLRFLVPGLKETLDGFGITAQTIDRIACVRGPGSFTGLRLLLAAAQGMSAGTGAQLAGIDYLPLLAAGPGPLLDTALHVLTYARRGLVYLQSFDAPSLAPLSPLSSCTLAEAAQRMASLGNTAHLMGSGLRRNPDFFASLVAETPGFSLLPARWDTPSCDQLLDAAQTARYQTDPLEPAYVRPSDAETNLPQLARKRGLDPDEMDQRLKTLRQKQA
ncbi:MAG: tRNA (adenosine(37)-N6)-threonylcarbamoyltransferase complex dimerization subunit type 1 TsaB [Pseudodesulfovibrio sp.]|uniref:Peptidase M22 glycoprotease n=1 Tax=Pseudodesulfovibrio aespoeensis (strain ATCC 700646 / DSM 10631 / Aspo-2) TaxID=643562 RepID=E6VSV0_PSEA9|nr:MULTISPECIES: tRNA (adenosine(37)-N6)-threonylcarbamoyltransferase complex dimerization subunit type 1 TsaB [Pseudodesulfovibrio]MBU4190745.1 tRNA (adenosine(37)-N6)-threonylcarbamoyltransferase complex dimerization subunit type 1 TsaB [Pseudomonadota bacterium]ADU63194.1 peptidase M22 glycoprotease [Pseudodesulfovibrio aespoeensis Aspo-2]MBU4243258.1 tRNA (adenosine(37)-N6)-threonylcarbamoyltransferase complex dimerization subunit type 1 TsaB [Pseudomonadota bacterium]MBU4379143.1 tRNA (ade